MSADREATGIADETPRGTRAAKACRRCHRKKLRCFGGHPCSSCKKAHQSCDFGESSSSSGPANGTVNGTVKEDLDKRFKDLETLVHGILDRVTPQSKRPFPDAPANNSNSTNNQYLSNYMPSPSQSCLLTGDETGGFGSFPTGNGDLPQQPDLDLRLSPYTRPNTRPLLGLPEVSVNETIDDLLASSRSPPTPSSLIHVRNRNQGSAEGRLALLAQVGSRYSAPLRPLSFQPAHWENADHTRPPSPTRDSEEHTLSDDFWNAMEVRPGLRDDPLGLQWIDQVTADRLVSLYVTYCHPFLPILELCRAGDQRTSEIQEMGAFLFTTILAIASRYTRRQARPSGLAMPELDQDASLKIRRLAYAHFASSMFRRHQSLRDLQATFLLAGWGLHPGAEGPEAWMTTGHCGRLALRLGLHKLGRTAMPIMPPLGSQIEMAKLVSRWKTWLCWFSFDTSLELGFGRPTTSRSEPNEDAFLPVVDQMEPNADRASCLYLIGLTKLTRISRAMWTWSQMLADDEQSDRASSDVLPLLTQLNGQLDQWTTMWLWIGSPYYLRLGRYVRLLKIQSEHVRLCLNALALKEAFAEILLQDSSFDRDQYVQKAAMAALDILQAFCESVSSDYHLVFCTDYITLIVGHAVVFLIRLYLAPRASPIDSAVLLHYLDTTTTLLESSDMSVLGQGSDVSRTCRELCRVVQIPLPGTVINKISDGGQNRSADSGDFSQTDFFSDTNLFGEGVTNDAFDLNAFLGVPAFDPGWDPLGSM